MMALTRAAVRPEISNSALRRGNGVRIHGLKEGTRAGSLNGTRGHVVTVSSDRSDVCTVLVKLDEGHGWSRDTVYFTPRFLERVE